MKIQPFGICECGLEVGKEGMMSHVNSRRHRSHMMRAPVRESYDAFMTEETLAQREQSSQQESQQRQLVIQGARQNRERLFHNNVEVAAQSIPREEEEEEEREEGELRPDRRPQNGGMGEY